MMDIDNSVDIPDFKNPENSAFIKKHGRSLRTGFLLSRPELISRIITGEKIKMGLGCALIASLFVNYVQSHYPQQHDLRVSLSNDTHDTILTTTMSMPLNTNVLVTSWATRVVCSAFTMTFADIDEVMAGDKKYFTEGGFLGFQKAMAEFSETMQTDRLRLSVAPYDQSVLTHNPTQEEPWWTIQVPVVMTFDAGTDASRRTVKRIATVKVVPVKPAFSITGHAIDSILLE